MYVNITMPYYFFIVDDPDGNEIEVTGNYSSEEWALSTYKVIHNLHKLRHNCKKIMKQVTIIQEFM